MWGQAIFIIIVYLVLTGYVTTSIGVKTIRENWGEYRCNPLVLPFASQLSPTGSSTSENFSHCVRDFALNAAPALTAPFSYVQSMTLDLLGSMVSSNESSMKQNATFSFSVSSMFTAINNVLVGMVVEFNIMVFKMVDIQRKIVGSMTVLMYIMATVQNTFVSMWRGIPGQLLRSAEKLSKK